MRVSRRHSMNGEFYSLLMWNLILYDIVSCFFLVWVYVQNGIYVCSVNTKKTICETIMTCELKWKCLTYCIILKRICVMANVVEVFLCCWKYEIIIIYTYHMLLSIFLFSEWHATLQVTILRWCASKMFTIKLSAYWYCNRKRLGLFLATQFGSKNYLLRGIEYHSTPIINIDIKKLKKRYGFFGALVHRDWSVRDWSFYMTCSSSLVSLRIIAWTWKIYCCRWKRTYYILCHKTSSLQPGSMTWSYIVVIALLFGQFCIVCSALILANGSSLWVNEYISHIIYAPYRTERC